MQNSLIQIRGSDRNHETMGCVSHDCLHGLVLDQVLEGHASNL